jgi:hypothetical protein
MANPKITFLAFFLIWAKHRNWVVPRIHILACHWLEHRGALAVLRCFRGFGKSTLLAIYNAWRYYCNPQYRILHQSEADGTAYKTSRDTQNVLRNHPLTRGMFRDGGVEQWWVEGASDPRNASMYAKGILSNVTSARAEECQNDDVEVPRNIQTPEAREKLRYRLGEQTHILVPGGRQLYIGTPHCHDSLYDEQEQAGADCLTIRMFEEEHRIEDAKRAAYDLPFIPEFVFSGIGKHARLLTEGRDFKMQGKRLVFAAAPGGLVDCYAGSAWPERFDRAELLKRRKKTRTINEWDSQYQLHSKPIHEIRLNPDHILAYDVEPVVHYANNAASMRLGKTRIVGMAARWDPSSGKLKSDVSAFAIVLQDEQGRRYLHRTVPLIGAVAEFSDDGKTITGGQVWQICDLVEEFNIPRVVIETNGIGQFAPAVLKAALKQRKLTCGVAEEPSIANKNKRILEAFEPLLLSQMLWAHVSVLDGPFGEQMRDFNPKTQNQEDDYIDAAAAASSDVPERINIKVTGSSRAADPDWRPDSGSFEVEVDYG